MLGGRSVERPYNLLIIRVLPLLSRSDNTVYYPRTTVRGKVAIPLNLSRGRDCTSTHIDLRRLRCGRAATDFGGSAAVRARLRFGLGVHLSLATVCAVKRPCSRIRDWRTGGMGFVTG